MSQVYNRRQIYKAMKKYSKNCYISPRRKNLRAREHEIPHVGWVNKKGVKITIRRERRERGGKRQDGRRFTIAHGSVE